MNALLILALLAAPPKAKEGVSAPELELIIPERLIAELLEAAAPLDQVIDQEVALMGFSKKVRLNLRLSKPRVKVTKKGIRVTLHYDLRGPGGTSSRGEVTPTLELRALAERGQLEGRLVGAKLSATGVEVPVEDLVEPFRFPAEVEGPLELGSSRVQTHLHAREVILEEGRVRVIGAWSFRRAAPLAAEPQEAR